MKKNEIKSKKATMSTLELVVWSVIIVAAAFIILFIYSGGTSRFSKSIGCGGIFARYTSSQDYFCHSGETCPAGSEPAGSSAWAVISGGCGSGKTCCIGKNPGSTGSGGIGEGKGVIEVRIDDVKILGQNEATPKSLDIGSTAFTILGTGDIKTCEVNVWKPGKDEMEKVNKIAKGTGCTNKVTFSYNFEAKGKYQLDVIGYNSAGQQIASMKIYIEVVEEAAPVQPNLVFELYDNDGVPISSESQYETDQSSIEYNFDCNTDCELRVFKEESGGYNIKTVISQKGNSAYSLEIGNYLFELRYKEGGQWKEYDERYLVTRKSSGGSV